MSRCSTVCGITPSSAATVKKHEIDAVRAREHVADETLVPGHIDDADAGTVMKIEVREAQVDGDAPLLLLFQPICVLTGERLDEARLAVIDVAGGPDNERHGCCDYSRRRRGRSGRPLAPSLQFGTTSSGSKIVRTSRRNRSSCIRPMIGGQAWTKSLRDTIRSLVVVLDDDDPRRNLVGGKGAASHLRRGVLH